jgi:hypothetical protein
MIRRTPERVGKFLWCFLALSLTSTRTDAATITVTGTGDAIAVDGVVTLREAITSANNNANVNADVVAVGAYGTDTINFNIAGDGYHTISPSIALPTISDPVIIDGYTQPGSARNTQVSSDDAVPLIELEGSSAGDANGFTLAAGANTIRGLVINRFTSASQSAGNAIALSSGSGNVIEGNFIGTDVTGALALPNENNAIRMESGANDNLIGGTDPAARNVIAGNGNAGLFIASAGNFIQGNLIGTQRDGRSVLGNLQGVAFGGNANNNLVGGIVPGAGNVIAFNTLQGVVGESGAGSGNSILGNSIFSNGGLGIDWLPEGPTLNDAGDGDDGFDKLQNSPVISTVQVSFPPVTLTGSLNSLPNTAFRLEFFGNVAADSSGFGEGEFYLGSTDVTTNASGDASYSVTLDLPGTPAAIAFTATATDSAGNTSEFSAAFRTKLLNTSTRMQVLTGDDVAIGGFIITGLSPKTVIVRAIGPSLDAFGVTGALADPVLELHLADGSVITNDNWKETQQEEIEATGLMPTDNFESAIVESLNPGAYTAVLRGKKDTIGVGLVETYDLDQPVDSQLANISTRGFVDTGDKVMIGGFIVGPSQLGTGTVVSTVVVRAIGPSLGELGVANPLQDPTLELHDENGLIIAFDDDWKDSQEAEIEAAQLAPTNERESALEQFVISGAYTAIVRGIGDTTGVALVEVYFVN